MRDLFTLTVRQLTGRWRLVVILAVGALPIINAAIQVVTGNDVTAVQIDDVLIRGMLAGAVLPLIVLTAASAAFANEVEDRTLSNLTLTPVPRWAIVAPKLAAAIATGAPMPVISGVVAVLVLMDNSVLGNGTQAAVATGIGLLVGAFVYAAIFLWAGLVTTRAIGFGLLYVFLWEGLFSSYVSGIRYLSVRQYVIGIVHGIDPDRFAGATNVLSFPVAAGASAVVFVAFALLAVRRLRTMDVP